jgi:hypothetical protein
MGFRKVTVLDGERSSKVNVNGNDYVILNVVTYDFYFH